MDSRTGRELVTVARFGEEAIGSKVEYHSKIEDLIDYKAAWGATRIASYIIPRRLAKLRDRYYVPHSREMLVPETHRRAYFPRSGSVAVSEYLFKVGIRLLLHPFFRGCT